MKPWQYPGAGSQTRIWKWLGSWGGAVVAAGRQEYSFSPLDKGHQVTQGLAIMTSMPLSLLDPKALQPGKEREGWGEDEGEGRLKLWFLSLQGPQTNTGSLRGL